MYETVKEEKKFQKLVAVILITFSQVEKSKIVAYKTDDFCR